MKGVYFILIFYCCFYETALAQQKFPQNGSLYEQDEFYKSLLNGDPVQIDDSFKFYRATLQFFYEHRFTYRLCDFVGQHEKTYSNISEPSSVYTNSSFFSPTDALLVFPFFLISISSRQNSSNSNGNINAYVSLKLKQVNGFTLALTLKTERQLARLLRNYYD